MTDADLIAHHIATRGVTKCPPGVAAYGFTPGISVTTNPSEVCNPSPTAFDIKRAQVNAKRKLRAGFAVGEDGMTAPERVEAKTNLKQAQNEQAKLKRLERLARIRQRHEAGMPVAENARLEKCGTKRLRMMLREAGIDPGRRKRLDKPMPPIKDIPPEVKAAILSEYADGWGSVALSTKYNVSCRTVLRWTNEAGITRPKGAKGRAGETNHTLSERSRPPQINTRRPPDADRNGSP